MGTATIYRRGVSVGGLWAAGKGWPAMIGCKRNDASEHGGIPRVADDDTYGSGGFADGIRG